MSIQDEYAKRIDSYDRVLHEAREAHRKALAWGRVHTPHWAAEYDEAGQRYQDTGDATELDNQDNVLGWMANHRVSREELAVIHATAARERAMQAWEREMDDEDARDMYGLIPKPRKEMTHRNHDNVITVDFRGRTRAPRTNRRPRG